ncbi:type 1 glutamine amidotransferase [Halogeometricum borinquense]|uniref:Type 1 glutamine amidotransferase n=1 Tax=Halogeometricum borinquense TaxID=60847 RepID=A0A482T384_9EURY|nr:type 1 glutamine amidotransferase [Halogeometricum borinquense]RYJ08592.1 type 1 glutamine amidotransferase [Halogeometricum borinquense]
MGVRIALLDASVGNTPAERNFRRVLDAEVTTFKLSEGQLPPPVTSRAWVYDGVVISGSQISVYDDNDWIHGATEWFRRAQAAGVPTLGVCWGHQFIAQAVGGRVVDMHEYELGYRTITRVGDSPLFEGVPRRFTAFETHSDRVAEVPPGAVTLARNDFGVQAFRVGGSYGVQFHPEYDRETAEWVTKNKELPEERIQHVLDGINENAVADANVSKAVFDNFVKIVTTTQPTQSDEWSEPTPSESALGSVPDQDFEETGR